jgi:tetratricopeptide (TPR) repeat protein
VGHPAHTTPQATPRLTASRVLEAAREQDLAAQLDRAIASYTAAIRLAESTGDRAVLMESLRRLAVVQHRRNNAPIAQELCRRSLMLAEDEGDAVEAGEAFNALGGFSFEAGEMSAARVHFQHALARSNRSPELKGRVEQNLGVLATIRGDIAEADAHYWRSLEAFESSGSSRGAALAWHNLGLFACAQCQLDVAEERLTRGAELAESTADVHLAAVCELGMARVLYGRGQFEDAAQRAEGAMVVLEQIDLPLDRSGAHRLLGMILRASGRTQDAAHHLRSAVRLAVETRWVLGEAEALLEMARLNLESGLKTEAMTLLSVAHGLFVHVEARLEVEQISEELNALAAA